MNASSSSSLISSLSHGRQIKCICLSIDEHSCEKFILAWSTAEKVSPCSAVFPASRHYMILTDNFKRKEWSKWLTTGYYACQFSFLERRKSQEGKKPSAIVRRAAFRAFLFLKPHCFLALECKSRSDQFSHPDKMYTLSRSSNQIYGNEIRRRSISDTHLLIDSFCWAWFLASCIQRAPDSIERRPVLDLC